MAAKRDVTAKMSTGTKDVAVKGIPNPTPCTKSPPRVYTGAYGNASQVLALAGAVGSSRQ